MRCVVAACNRDSNSTSSQGITFHMFPEEQSLRLAWLKALHKEGWSPTETSAVCSTHFLVNDLYLTKDGQCKLRDGAVPSTYEQEEPKGDMLMIACDVKVCRICFATDCNLYSMKLFKNLKQAYESLAGLSIDKEDNMPQYLCSECSHQLMNSSNFRNKILNAHLTLKEILQKHECITLDRIKCSNRKQGLVNSNHETTHKQTYQYDLEIEPIKDENIDSEEQSIPTELHSPHEHFILEDIKKEQDVVNTDSLSDQDITQDIVYSPILHKYIVPGNFKEEQNDTYNLDRDNYQNSANIDMMHDHVVVGENYNANVVRTVQEAEAMAIRIAETVEKLTKLPENFNRPMYETNRNPSLESDSKVISDNSSTDIRSDDSSEKPFTCSICKKSFSQKSWLMNHLRIHSGERPYTCDVCKKTFNDKSNYRKHLRIHSGEKPFPCTFCDKAFNRKSYLENHLRTHSGVKPYSCGVCNKVFGHKHHLKSHLRIHSGEKPYSCPICKKEFSEKSNLHMHLKVHSGDRLFSCEECRIAFSTRYLLKCHSRVHSDISNEKSNVT